MIKRGNYWSNASLYLPETPKTSESTRKTTKTTLLLCKGESGYER